jgi:hypothetical protein
LLGKPFTPEQLLATVTGLLGDRPASSRSGRSIANLLQHIAEVL